MNELRCLSNIGILMLKTRRSRDCLIFNMGIPIPGKEGLYIETRPWSVWFHGIQMAPLDLYHYHWHYLNQCWYDWLTQICGTRGRWINMYIIFGLHIHHFLHPEWNAPSSSLPIIVIRNFHFHISIWPICLWLYFTHGPGPQGGKISTWSLAARWLIGMEDWWGMC